MSLLKTIDSIKGSKSARVVYVTPFETLEKSRGSTGIPKGTPTPDTLECLKRIVTRVVNIGNDYTTAVENQLSKAIQAEFPILTKAEAGTAAGHIWQTDEHKWAEVDPAYKSGNIYRSRKNPDQKYIRIYEDMSSKVCEGGMFNPTTGHMVTVSWAEMVAFCKKNPETSGSKKQEDAGLAKQVKFRLVSAENVKYFKCGSAEYDALSDTEKTLLEDLKD